jgi:hypothetical protein
MPTVAKSTGTIAKLGDPSTFSVSTSAIPVDTADSAGAVPTLTATFVNGTYSEYLVGESLTLTAPSVGKFKGKVISHSKAANSDRYNLSVDSLLARLNSELRTYPLSDYSSVESTYIPLYSLEYWTQQCGVFYTDMPGDVLFYQSGYGHLGAYGKDITKPIRSLASINAGGTLLSMSLVNGRVWSGFGVDCTAFVGIPKEKLVPVPVPTTASGKRIVFGASINLTGTGRTGSVTWYLNGKGSAKPAVRLSYDTAAGFTVWSNTSGTYVSNITVPTPGSGVYHCYLSVSMGATQTRLNLTVLDATGLTIYSGGVDSAQELSGTLALREIRYLSNAGGSGGIPSYANVFVTQTKGDVVSLIPDAKTLTLGSKGAKFMVGFNGNVWEHIKEYCSIYHLDVSYVSGKLTIGPRQRDITFGANLSEGTQTTQNREQARNVEVVNQGHTPTGSTPTVLWQADSVYQVAVGEVQTFNVQTPHSILDTSQPVCVSGISPFPYKTGAGQYVVTGSDGYIVSPTFWRDQGGKITTETTDVEGEIKITIKGPDYDSPRAPYRISEGDAGRPALYVTGYGILAAPKTLKVGTGNTRAAKDVGVSLDSPFISNTKLAYDAAARAAQTFATPESTMSLAEPLDYDTSSTLGTYPAGSLVKMNGNVLRVVSATQGPSVFSGSAAQHNTIYQLKRSFAGMTIKQQKDYYAGKTIGQVNIRPMRKVV